MMLFKHIGDMTILEGPGETSHLTALAGHRHIGIGTGSIRTSIVEITGQGIKCLQLLIDVGASPARLLSNIAKPHRCLVRKTLSRCSLL